MTIRILLVDDHSVVRQGLRLFLKYDPELDVVGEAADDAEVGEMARPLIQWLRFLSTWAYNQCASVSPT